MKIDEKFNGWTNYATWRVMLEVIDPVSDDLAGWSAEELKISITETIEAQGELLAKDYAIAFLSEVNWYEIADHLREEYGLCKSCNEPTMDEYCTECDKENETMISYDKG